MQMQLNGTVQATQHVVERRPCDCLVAGVRVFLPLEGFILVLVA